MVDGGEPGVDSRDEGKHTGRNDLLFVEKKSLNMPDGSHDNEVERRGQWRGVWESCGKRMDWTNYRLKAATTAACR